MSRNQPELDPDIVGEIRARGIEPGLVLSQIEMFERGMPPAHLVGPCTPGDGIVTIWGEAESYARLYESGSARREIVKFVPA
ncbi:MAG TPA: DUF4301 family protein, partial [Thermodesulfobacteriota bacterium]|nr:DUF4301 family protein [Thermodesulfobacteriota bacterium]